MRKIYLTLITILIIHIANAQNTPWSTTGNIGIGTTSPANALTVVGSQDTYPGNTATFSSNSGSANIYGNQMNITNSTASWGLLAGFDGPGVGTSLYHGPNTCFLINVPNAPLILGTNNAANVTILPSGYVGIGTTTPLAKLQIVGTIITSGSSANLDPSQSGMTLSYLANSASMLIGWNRTAASGETDFIANSGPGAPGGFAFYNHDNNNVETQLMWVMGNGNVLIGKTSQTNSAYKLDVAGNARFNNVVVNTTGADFVFEPTYHLFPLADLKKYLDQNHHLPEIPSAKEMQANGLNVGDNQIKLLQKVEELTLYVIDKDKQISDLQAIVCHQQETNLKQSATNQAQQQQLQSQQEEIDLLIKQVAALSKK